MISIRSIAEILKPPIKGSDDTDQATRFQYVVTTYFLRLSGPGRPPFSDKFDQMDWLFGQEDWLYSCDNYDESGMNPDDTYQITWCFSPTLHTVVFVG